MPLSRSGPREKRLAKLVVGCGLVGALACAPNHDARIPSTTPPQQVTPVGNPGAPIAPPEEAEVRSEVREVLAEMAELRGLAPKSGVLANATSRAALRTWLKNELETSMPPEVLDANQALLIGLGVAPAGFDYRSTVENLMTEELAGVYDPKTKTMHLLSDLGPEEARATLRHELVHALQDQHYDLEAMIGFKPDAGDQQTALHALAEGDATSAMIDAMLPEGRTAAELSNTILRAQMQEMLAQKNSPSAPPILMRSLMAPYLDGLLFVHWARKQGGWSRVDEVWKRPPKSTEQVLHPEKWAADEKPEAVTVPPPPPNGPENAVYTDVLGEQSLRILLEEWLAPTAAEESASGWAGDRVAVFREQNRWAIAWHVAFDDVASAERAHEALYRGLMAEQPTLALALTREKARAALSQRALCRARPGLGPVAVVQNKTSLVVLLGPYQLDGATPRGLGSCKDTLKWAGKTLGSRASTGRAQVATPSTTQ